MVDGLVERCHCLCASMKVKENTGARLLRTQSYGTQWDAQSKKHANKVRLFYMLHPEDGGPPSKRLRPDNPRLDTEQWEK
ncbi:hypothetical protein INR49_021775 [Caranx melampygus]|nr:hypothetical protein INR49_021775 [Caranx melampygus]